MFEAFGAVLPHAVAVALSPMPIAALILLLLSNRAKLNSSMFLLGWFLGLIVNVGIVAFIFDSQPTVVSNQKSLVSIAINLILGIFLLYLALRQWNSRPKPGTEAKTPNWLQSLEHISPIKTFIIAFGLVTINAKNTVLDIASGVTIGQLTSTSTQAMVVVFLYAVIASLTILFPVVAFLLMGNKLSGVLTDVKAWFIQNSATILFVLFLILGISLISKAIGTN